MKDFRDLVVWQESHKLVLLIYHATSDFPADERFGLISQMRRSAVSITSNISEGFGRRFFKDKARFYVIAQASLCELQNQLIISHDLSFITKEQFSSLYNKTNTSHKLLTGLIRSIQNKS